MNDSSPRTSRVGESFTVRGRPFLRFTWAEPDGRPAELAVAETIAGRYRVENLLAPGEGGVLLRARDLRTRKAVVIKGLRNDLRPDPGTDLTPSLRHARHRLQTERRLLVRLRNAGCNNVPIPDDYVYDLNPVLAESSPPIDELLVETEPFLVLQELTGVLLEDLLRDEFPDGLDERQALDWIAPVVRTLEVLQEPWRLGGGRTWHCVYQDLKPANIMIDALGRPTLLDFGGCQVVVDGVPVLEGACTSGYAPPECEGPATRVLLPCADVYGIGSTLFHLLTGEDPSELRTRRRGRPGAHLDLRALPKRCSPGVRQLLERCLAPRPSDRLADAGQVGRAIKHLTESP
jgi:serine/threonine protein kinase